MSVNLDNNKKKLKVLITGANGFVGSKIVHGLPNEDVEITAVLRNSSSLQANISSCINNIYSNDIFLESVDCIDNCKNIDIVIHSAWYAGLENTYNQ